MYIGLHSGSQWCPGSVILLDLDGRKVKRWKEWVCSLWDTRGPSKWKDNHQTVRNAKWKAGCTYLFRNSLWIWSHRNELKDLKSKIKKNIVLLAETWYWYLTAFGSLNIKNFSWLCKLLYPRLFLDPGLFCATCIDIYFDALGFHNRIPSCTFRYF